LTTDRELLELAAKAAGISHDGVGYVSATGCPMNWNPLSDDGDAMRLAVDLDIYFMVVREQGHVSARIRNGVRSSWTAEIGSDARAAARRAIVLAASAAGNHGRLAS
jgi:hypothetical protein